MELLFLLSQIQFENVSLAVTCALCVLVGFIVIVVGFISGSRAMTVVGALICVVGIVGWLLTVGFVNPFTLIPQRP